MWTSEKQLRLSPSHFRCLGPLGQRYVCPAPYPYLYNAELTPLSVMMDFPSNLDCYVQENYRKINV